MRPPARLLCLVFAVAAVAACRREEPRYQGRSSSHWVSSLASTHASERRRACEAIAAIGPLAAPALPRVLTLLGDAEDDVGLAAAEALVGLGPRAIASLETRIGVDEAPLVRLHGAYALIQLVPAHDGATSVLIELVTTASEPWIAQRAASLLVALGGPLAARVAALLADPYPPVRLQALRVLGGMGEAAAEQVAGIAGCLRDADRAVRVEAVRTLGRVGPAEAVRSVLRTVAGGGDPALAETAREALDRLGAR